MPSHRETTGVDSVKIASNDPSCMQELGPAMHQCVVSCQLSDLRRSNSLLIRSKHASRRADRAWTGPIV